ncbi:H-2 class I histocompatibility antigen, Q10 alpha chain-like isoform X2 [Tachysurus vachellii]|nr:H-2 class I histocompatibility antigen, Q10 alpha chain-like isoform X2 [Tachysurus vachellii]
MMLRMTLLILFGCGGVSAVTQSLQLCYTAFVQGINLTKLTAAGVVNEAQFIYFNGNVCKMIPNLTAEDEAHWTHRMQGEREDFKFLLSIINEDDNFNNTKGAHTVQWTYSCDLKDDNTTGGNLQYVFDGKDFMSLNLTSATWITSTFIKTKWDGNGKKTKYWKDFLERECTNWLKKVMKCSREILERNVRPEALVFQKHWFSPEVVCHATGFFPKAVTISWTKDREEVHDDVELRETLPNQDGSFQKRSIMNVSAEELQKHNYTCVIQHSSLEKELVLNVSERQILNGSGGGSDGWKFGVIVAVVVTLFVVAAVLMFFWKKRKSSGAEKPQEVQQNGTELHPLN